MLFCSYDLSTPLGQNVFGGKGHPKTGYLPLPTYIYIIFLKIFTPGKHFAIIIKVTTTKANNKRISNWKQQLEKFFFFLLLF